MRINASAGQRRHRVRVQGPDGAPMPDGDGGSVQGWIDLDPPDWLVSIEPPTGRDLQRFAHATIVAGRSLVVSGPYHPGVSTHARLLFGTRVLRVAGFDRPAEGGQTIALCVEDVEPQPNSGIG